MYQYYKGILIREGTEGIPSQQLRELYEKMDWCSPSMPQWQNEKFSIAFVIRPGLLLYGIRKCWQEWSEWFRIK